MVRISKFVQRSLVVSIAGCCAALIAMPVSAQRGPIFPGAARPAQSQPQPSKESEIPSMPAQMMRDNRQMAPSMPPKKMMRPMPESPQMQGPSGMPPQMQKQMRSMSNDAPMAPPSRMDPNQNMRAPMEPPIVQNDSGFEAPQLPPQARGMRGPEQQPRMMNAPSGRPGVPPFAPPSGVALPPEQPFKLAPDREMPRLPNSPVNDFRNQREMQPNQMLNNGSDARMRVKRQAPRSEKSDNPMPKRPMKEKRSSVEQRSMPIADPTGPSVAREKHSPRSRMQARNRQVQSNFIEPGVGVADRSLPGRAKAKSQGRPYGSPYDEIIELTPSEMNSKEFRVDSHVRAEERAYRRIHGGKE